MANVLNEHVFAAKDAPLKQLQLRVDRNLLKVTGALHKKGDIGFAVDAAIAATPDGKIKLHAEKIKAGPLPVKGLMDLLGIELSDLINTSKVRGVVAKGDDLILDPAEILPAPHIEGRVQKVWLEGDAIVQLFGATKMPELHAGIAGNYMAYRGNQLRFGKLTMDNTDMILIDMDPRDPFDFYLDHYKEQLVAGYTKTTPGFGLRVFMRDFNKLRASKVAQGHASH
jgi:hypothetical protein